MSDKEELEVLKKTFEDFIMTSAQLEKSYEFLKEESQRLSLYLSNILENMNAAILVFDTDFRLNLWNGGAHVYFPYLKGKKPPLEMEQLNQQPAAPFDVKNILEIGKPTVEREAVIEGEQRWLEIEASDFIDYRQEKTGYLLMIHDKTEFKQLQLRTQQEDRLRVMGELAAEVAHEIRNPLGSIELMVTLLQDDCKENQRSSELLSRIRTSVDNMNHIVTNILLYTKELQLERSEFQAQALVDAAESIALNTIVKKAVTMEKHVGDITLNGDFELLKQSLANIVINAAQAAPHKGTIRVETEIIEQTCRLKVIDNGPGIPEEVKEKIFKPFFTTKNTGTGLGLAMVKRVVETHEGRIFFESGAEGTLFIIEIPLK